jgi:putative transcriptional regulator
MKLILIRFDFFLGYSGWSNGQLNEELKEKTWLTVSATRNLIFHQARMRYGKTA